MIGKREAIDIKRFLILSSTPDKVDATMAAINEQREIANEISEAISNPLTTGVDIDEVPIFYLETCS